MKDVYKLSKVKCVYNVLLTCFCSWYSAWSDG